MLNKIYYLPLLLVSIMFTACKNDTKKAEKAKIDKELTVDDDLIGELNMAKQVFYALPSPIETAMLIKRAGTTFDQQILNPDINVDKYSTQRSKALNFGVYGADLSYASLFSQTQIAIKYMVVSKKLAEDLGILSFVEKDIVDRLEKNVNNRDSTLQIITDGFMTSNMHLKESGRPEIAALIIAGGWVEGLYIATQLALGSPNNNELVDRIIDQKISLITLIGLLELYQNNNDVAQTLTDLKQIESIYNQIQVVTSVVEPVTSDNEKVTSLKAKTDVFISEQVFNNLCTKVDSIRNVIVSI